MPLRLNEKYIKDKKIRYLIMVTCQWTAEETALLVGYDMSAMHVW